MTVKSKLTNLVLALPVLMCAATNAQAQSLGYEKPGADQAAELQFQMLVGDVLEEEQAADGGGLGGGDIEAALRAPAYDSSNDTQGRNCVNQIEDQGNCGSCWAFGSTAVLESAYCEEFGTIHNLAEQTVLECRKDIGVGGDHCGGGSEYVAYDVMRGQGLDLEANLKYDFRNFGTCKGPASGATFFGIDGDIHLTRTGAQPSIDDIKAAIVKSGAVTVVFAVTPPFDNYRAGSAPIVNTESDLMSVRGWHLVAITGWDDTRGAWRIKNSWGNRGWGDNGFGWLTYNDISIDGDGFSTVIPRSNRTKEEQARIVSKVIESVEPALLNADPVVQWPTSLGFPEEKLTVNQGIEFAKEAGLYDPAAPVAPEGQN